MIDVNSCKQVKYYFFSIPKHKHFSIYSQEFNVKHLQHKYFTSYCFMVENDNKFLIYVCSRKCNTVERSLQDFYFITLEHLVKEPDIVLKDNLKLCFWPAHMLTFLF